MIFLTIICGKVGMQLLSLGYCKILNIANYVFRARVWLDFALFQHTVVCKQAG